MSLIRKAVANEFDKPVRKRLILMTIREIKISFLAPKRAARNPPMTARQRYPIKLPVPMRPTCV
jgi:hypothetical protein